VNFSSHVTASKACRLERTVDEIFPAFYLFAFLPVMWTPARIEDSLLVFRLALSRSFAHTLGDFAVANDTVISLMNGRWCPWACGFQQFYTTRGRPP